VVTGTVVAPPGAGVSGTVDWGGASVDVAGALVLGVVDSVDVDGVELLGAVLGEPTVLDASTVAEASSPSSSPPQATRPTVARAMSRCGDLAIFIRATLPIGLADGVRHRKRVSDTLDLTVRGERLSGR
jgi:hypothetical protein